MSQVFELKDGGARQQFETGAQRDTAKGKGRPELISPFMLTRLSKWLEQGAEKYEARNWEKGIPEQRCVASLFRHLIAHMRGLGDEDHLAAIIFNAMAIIHFQETGRSDMLDWPTYRTEPPNPPNAVMP